METEETEPKPSEVFVNPQIDTMETPNNETLLSPVPMETENKATDFTPEKIVNGLTDQPDTDKENDPGNTTPNILPSSPVHQEIEESNMDISPNGSNETSTDVPNSPTPLSTEVKTYFVPSIWHRSAYTRRSAESPNGWPRLWHHHTPAYRSSIPREMTPCHPSYLGTLTGKETKIESIIPVYHKL